MDAQQFEPSSALKGEIMDYEFSLDMDHRKRRRNRTTQSCLNCHTSKRKCDRKRPCQRCIQLGLTGLCVYEIDDPTIRDDPNVDESTRLRNRIAELESLVRELRGKPHPRWADANFCDGDPNEKWHSRASKRPSNMHLNLRRRRGSFDINEQAESHLPSSTTPIKSEPGDLAQQFPYRFSTSPDSANASPYHAYPPQSAATGSTTPYHEHQLQYGASSGEGSGSSSYSPYLQTPAISYNHAEPQTDPRYRNHHCSDVRSDAYCPCQTNPAAGHAMVSLVQQLQAALTVLRGLPEHSAHACTIIRRVQELNDLLHTGSDAYSSGSEGIASGSYDSLSTPPDSDVMTPLSSAESAPIRAAQLQEWHALSQAQGSGYNPYFPPLPPASERGGAVFSKDISVDFHHGVI
ncbi:hypothetical protein BV25DRAFT_1918396 [Artomyces pyxidatus]|uniref:Uncharacterized protein n=1 Tax=Artomyces pyxidatus TaxID=48021 RepID=A0ACB8SUW5_9AGAM|nr:hypothetical protein BV25DRAFT_1918396 [Artomyces pyxidatus]